MEHTPRPIAEQAPGANPYQAPMPEAAPPLAAPPPVIVPPTRKDRPAETTGAAVVGFIWALLFIALGASRFVSTEEPDWLVLLPLVPATLWVTGGIGLFQCRLWGFVLSCVAYGFWLVAMIVFQIIADKFLGVYGYVLLAIGPLLLLCRATRLAVGIAVKEKPSTGGASPGSGSPRG